MIYDPRSFGPSGHAVTRCTDREKRHDEKKKKKFKRSLARFTTKRKGWHAPKKYYFLKHFNPIPGRRLREHARSQSVGARAVIFIDRSSSLDTVTTADSRIGHGEARN